MNHDTAHDIATSLTAIKGLVSVLTLEDSDGAKRKEFYEIIDRECDRLTAIFNELKQAIENQTELTQKRDELCKREQEIEAMEEDIRLNIEFIDKEVQKIAGLTEQAARDLLLSKAESKARADIARRIKTLNEEADADAERYAKQAILNSIQRIAAEYTIEATTSVVQLPSEDMKGKLIGREGRNIRTFEQVTGVDLVIDESPETVIVSSFDPVRREIARITLMNLMLDGRIHPARIEELHNKAKEEIEKVVREAGENAADRAKVAGINKSVLQTLGRLRFRASYAQNVLDHSVEVAELCALFAEELGFNVEVSRRAGLLHDIGKALGPEWEGPHALSGMNYLKDQGETEAVLHAVGAHHQEIEPSTPEAQIVIIADAISAARPGARRESLDQYVKRVAKLEAMANSFPGVDRSYALQAGREIRLIVKPDSVNDSEAEELAAAVAKKIESELEYPGQIKITVIREVRVHKLAK